MNRWPGAPGKAAAGHLWSTVAVGAAASSCRGQELRIILDDIVEIPTMSSFCPAT